MTNWKAIAEEFGSKQTLGCVDRVQLMAIEIARLRVQAVDFRQHAEEWEEQRSEAIAANARLRAALEHLRKAFNEVHPSHPITNGCEPCMQDIRARNTLESSDGQKELEAVKEAARRIEFDDPSLYQKLRYAFGLSE